VTGWSEVEDGTTGTTTVDHGDYLNLNVTVSAGNEEYRWVNTDNIGISTTTYPTILWRYKTDGGSIKAKIVAVFSDASTQQVLADSSSSTFTVGSTTLTAAKTLDHIRLFADHATGDVWYDFVLVCQGLFTFPNAAYDITGTIPNRTIFLPIPMRQTDVTQQLGSGNMEFQIGCDMTLGDWTRATDAVNGQVFYDIAGEAPSEPWQWFDSEREQMKVTLEPPRFTRAASNTGLMDRLDLMLREYRLSDGDNVLETYATRWGLDL
jgi:hypothetical protein